MTNISQSVSGTNCLVINKIDSVQIPLAWMGINVLYIGLTVERPYLLSFISWTDTYVRVFFFLFLSSYTELAFAGSSSDQDGMMCRYTDTDSGLGRATPPRRAPSPGMGSMRHLPSPSGPGSLPPGLMTKRRVFDDGSSDISSTPSSMMDYNGKDFKKFSYKFHSFTTQVQM